MLCIAAEDTHSHRKVAVCTEVFRLVTCKSLKSDYTCESLLGVVWAPRYKV